jgi:hypothetical protein
VIALEAVGPSNWTDAMNAKTRMVLTLLALTAPAAAAQGLREVRPSSWSTGNISLLIAEPVGQFADFVGVHPGLGGSLTVGGPLGLRLAGAVLVYGHEEEYLAYPGSGGRIALDLDTDNLIFTAGIGPQLTMGDGATRLYMYGTLGFSYFATVSSLGGGWAETTQFDDWTVAREAGAGLQLRLARRRPVYLDLSARYLRNGRVRYLREGSIVERADGSYSIQPYESHANIVVFQIGISVGLR